jgi:pyruvate,water dikinase
MTTAPPAGIATVSIAWPDALTAGAPIGGKAEGLRRLTEVGLPVPAWFVVLPEAFAPDATGALALTDAARQELIATLGRLCPGGERVAVRSSASEEDSAAFSFAGQFETRLSVAPAAIETEVARVARSAAAPRVDAYRKRVAVAASTLRPTVIVQRQIDARASGVAFSADPVSGRRGLAVVAAVRGVGAQLVSGSTNADTWTVDRLGTIATATPSDFSHGGPALDEVEVRAVAALARRAEHVFGCPQDIEWCIADGRLYLLQSRPVTALAELADPDAPATVWDCSNITENYGGVTTPLTFSFAREVYAAAYRAFCAEVGVGGRRIEALAYVFRGMIGLVRGRMYYNLNHWYDILRLLPGYRWNRPFLESMMGIAEPTAGDFPKPDAATATARWLDLLRLIWVALRLLAGLPYLPRRIARFQSAMDTLLAEGAAGLDGLRADELTTRYRALEIRLRQLAGTPTMNDFWTMTAQGVARRLGRAWLDADADRFCNEGLRLRGPSISRAIADSFTGLVREAAATPGLLDAFANGPRWRVEEAISAAPTFAPMLERYVELYGDRVPGELKLETVTLRDDPMPLLRAIGNVPLAPRERAAARDDRAEVPPPRLKAARRVALTVLLRWARVRLQDREALRFLRTRIFGLARRLLMELGRRLFARGAIDDPRDVLYLEVQEVLDFAEGWVTTADLRALVAIRKADFAGFAAATPPPVRFRTRDVPCLVPAAAANEEPMAPPGHRMTGIGCSAGIATGRVRIVSPPEAGRIDPDDIVVAHRTDPGWVTLLPNCRGLVVEVGNPLSHGAIIARELGMPMIAMLPGVVRWLRTGDRVTIDGSAGTIVRHPETTE